MKVVLDTNVIISSLSSRSKNHWIVEAFENNKFALCVTTDILLEYEEKLIEKYGKKASGLFLRALDELPNVIQVQKYFNWQLLRHIDPDDDKFIDAAIASSADYLVTEDHDFHPLRKLSFPKIEVLSTEKFKIVLNA